MVEFQTTNERNGLSITRGFYRVEAISEKRFQIYSPETLNKELNDDEQKLQSPANIAAKLQQMVGFSIRYFDFVIHLNLQTYELIFVRIMHPRTFLEVCIDLDILEICVFRIPKLQQLGLVLKLTFLQISFIPGGLLG